MLQKEEVAEFAKLKEKDEKVSSAKSSRLTKEEEKLLAKLKKLKDRKVEVEVQERGRAKTRD